jgi:LysR family hydrogen peroxide-inducible transcriptional activator
MLAPHAFTLRQLQYIIAVADELSFSRAAERCHVSQPSLSSQLAQVEDALGVRIFERGRKPVIVTAVGRDVVECARRALRAADEVQQTAQRAADPLSGTLRLGIIMTIAPYLLPTITGPLRRAFPRLRFEWIEERTETLAHRLKEGQVEGAIVALESRIGEVEMDVIAKDRFFLVTRREHPLAASTAAVSAAELRGSELLLLEDGHCLRDQALEVCSGVGAKEGEFRATSLLTLVQMIAGGGGATLLPELALAAEVSRARLHARPLAMSGGHRTIGLVWRKGSSTEDVLQAVAATIRANYPGGDGPKPSSSRRRPSP